MIYFIIKAETDAAVGKLKRDRLSAYFENRSIEKKCLKKRLQIFLKSIVKN